ncbi:MAG: preprotein translocase subunit SecE [Erysipelotrichia bacterium]|jgi:preprotein translocase SecE subunit|nr:preprotein translocase subunit SecE [Bacilli bacterium]NLB49778.1 preprotein translocase subunit SecE [Erysipelotrichia bacterium]
MGLKKYVTGVAKEGKRVRWPKRDVLLPAILTVVVITVFFGIMLLLEDWAGNSLLEILKDAFSNLAK